MCRFPVRYRRLILGDGCRYPIKVEADYGNLLEEIVDFVGVVDQDGWQRRGEVRFSGGIVVESELLILLVEFTIMRDVIANLICLAYNILLGAVVSMGFGVGNPPEHGRTVDVRDGRTSAVLAETWKPLEVTHNLSEI